MSHYRTAVNLKENKSFSPKLLKLENHDLSVVVNKELSIDDIKLKDKTKMYSFATESFDPDDLCAPELMNRAIKDWIEADDIPEATPESRLSSEYEPLPQQQQPLSLATPSNPPSLDLRIEKIGTPSPQTSVSLTPTAERTQSMFQIFRQSNDELKLPTPKSRSNTTFGKALSVNTNASPNTVILSSISMKTHQRCYCCYLPVNGHFSLCCMCCVICVPCYHNDVSLPSHSCQLLTCEGAGSYYTSSNFLDVKIGAKYTLCWDVLCFLCCGHYYCCVWDWIIDGSFACHCWRCNNQFIDLHYDIFHWTEETCSTILNRR